MTQPNTSPKRGVRRFDELNEGWSFCYECGGDGACVVCDGTGKDEGKPCVTCGHVGFCRLCDGEGQLAPTKKMVELVGFYRELGFTSRPCFPSILDARGMRLPTHKAEVVAYLQAGAPIEIAPGGVGQDVFDPTRTTTTRAILTDGRYAWSSELAYYVEHYDVSLNAPFEKHMEAQGYKMSVVDVTTLTLSRNSSFRVFS